MRAPAVIFYARYILVCIFSPINSQWVVNGDDEEASEIKTSKN